MTVGQSPVPGPSEEATGMPAGARVPAANRSQRRPTFLTPAARKAIRNRMLLIRQASVDRIGELTGADAADLKRFRQELNRSEVPDTLLARGAGEPFTRELPHGALLYLAVRALKPARIVETGVRPGYSTAWFLAGLEANRAGELISLGPGSPRGRVRGLGEGTVGEFVAPAWRTRWTLVLGNTEERLAEILHANGGTDLFFYDNGPEAERERFELHTAWSALSPRGLLLAHRVDANSTWEEFCRLQGVRERLVDSGPPPLGGLSVRQTQPRA